MRKGKLTKLAMSILGAIPADWDSATLGDLADLGSGGTPSRSRHDRYYSNGTTRWVKTCDLNNAVIRDTQEHITDLGLLESSCSVFPAKTLLIAMYGGFKQIGRTGLLAEPAATNQAITAIQVKDGSVDPEFLQHWLNVKVNAWRPVAGSSRKDPNITKSEIERFPVPLPPRLEQASICRILRTIGSQIDCVSDLYRSRRKLRRGLMQQLLTGRCRFPEFRNQRWDEVAIGDILQEITRPVKLQQNIRYRLVSIRRRSRGFFDREMRLGAEIGYPSLEQLATGDFVIARRQVLHGAMAIVPPEFNGAYVSNAYAILRPRDPSKLHLPFFNFISQQQYLYHLAYRCSYGVAIEKMFFRLNWFFRERLLIPPTVDEQKKVVAVLNAADDEIDRLRHLLKALKEQKRGLMQKLLTGKVRVPRRRVAHG